MVAAMAMPDNRLSYIADSKDPMRALCAFVFHRCTSQCLPLCVSDNAFK